jgi:hypothetical protein
MCEWLPTQNDLTAGPEAPPIGHLEKKFVPSFRSARAPFLPLATADAIAMHPTHGGFIDLLLVALKTHK